MNFLPFYVFNTNFHQFSVSKNTLLVGMHGEIVRILVAVTTVSGSVLEFMMAEHGANLHLCDV